METLIGKRVVDLRWEHYSNSRPVHTTLLGAGVLIVEHLCHLEALPPDGFIFSAIPPKFKGVGTFPVRAMARVERG